MFGKTLLAGVCLLSLCFTTSMAQQRQGSVRGQVTDELGALVVGATVTLVAADGTQRTATTNHEGVYTFNSVAPAAYTLRVTAPGFSA
jgi:protocatechuate 3,4-dioxygenase beta subunit